MFFKMLQRIFQWFSILIVVVTAFTAGVYKLTFISSSDAETEEKCKMVTKKVGFSFKQLFEDAISGGGSDLFDCQEGDSVFSFGNVLLYLASLFSQILLMNMLIAMMNEAFMSIYEAQEANHTYQKATHYREIADGKTGSIQPIQIFYFPFGVYDIFKYPDTALRDISWPGYSVKSLSVKSLTETQF